MTIKNELIKEIQEITDEEALEKLHIFLIGMIAQQNIKKETD